MEDLMTFPRFEDSDLLEWWESVDLEAVCWKYPQMPKAATVLGFIERRSTGWTYESSSLVQVLGRSLPRRDTSALDLRVDLGRLMGHDLYFMLLQTTDGKKTLVETGTPL